MSGFNFADYQQAFSKPNNLVPKRGMIFSDEDIRYRTPEQFNTTIRKKRLLLSDRNEKASSQTPYEFSTRIIDNIKNVRWIRPIKAQLTYTVPDPKVYNILVEFPSIDQGYQTTSDGSTYHFWINLVDGSTGDSVTFVENFNADTVAEFKDPVNINGTNFPVRLYAQDDSTGSWGLFTNLTRFSMEIEFNYLDFSFRNDIQIKL
jgi:hypothetical protein